MKYPIFDRLELLKIGYAKGVSLSWLSQQNNFFAMNLLELIDQQIIPSTCEKYFEEAYSVWEQQVALNNKKIASERWNSEAMLCQLIYSIIRAKELKLVVETGVANGISTGVALSALKHTGGVLHSFDILASCANLFPGAQNWNFHLLNLKKAPAELAEIVSNIQEIDLWIHDADHGTTWQRMEFALGTKKLKAGGLLISDDADASPAWGEMSKKLTHKSAILLDRRKIIGITPKLI